MIIPLEGERLVLMADVVALVRGDGLTEIVGRDGSLRTTGLTPMTLRARHRKLWTGGRLRAANLLQGGHDS
ncbi:MAG: hypothetical protein JMJ93_00490 [Synergistaceae bacterium]|jgi:hypothetical protein|nr:hypothetical protein [Synergistaceae bacterium]